MAIAMLLLGAAHASLLASPRRPAAPASLASRHVRLPTLRLRGGASAQDYYQEELRRGIDALLSCTCARGEGGAARARAGGQRRAARRMYREALTLAPAVAARVLVGATLAGLLS